MHKFSLAAAAAGLIVSCSMVGAAPVFRVQTVEPPSGYQSVVGLKVNNSGDFVGIATSSSESRHVVWLAEKGFVTIVVPGEAPVVDLAGINDKQEVAGRTSSEAFIWSELGGYRSIVAAAGYIEPRPTGLNRRGQVVGYAYLRGSDTNIQELRRAFIWSETAGMTIVRPHQYIEPVAINSRGDIVGTVEVDHAHASGNTAVIAFDRKSVSTIGDLFPDGALASSAVDLNDFGAIAVNAADFIDGTLDRACLWTKNSGLLALPISGVTLARAIDNRKQVLGDKRTGDFLGPFLWSSADGFMPLSSLFASGSPTLLDFFALDMSERTIIVGGGTENGITKAVLLIPL